MSDEQIANVITHIRTNFGNSSSAVTPEQIAWAREKSKGVNTPPLREELEKIKTDLPANP